MTSEEKETNENEPKEETEKNRRSDDRTRTILVTSTSEATGKTAITIALGLLASEKDLSVGYMKPKGTRLRSRVGKTLDEDPMLARELLDIQAEMHEFEPVVYSPTFVDQAIRGRKNPNEIRETVVENFEKLSEGVDLMLVEGGGELTTGGIIDLTDADVAELLDAEVVLVSPFESGTDLDDVLGAVSHIGDRLLGVIFNAVSGSHHDQVETDVTPFLEGRDIPVLGILPEKRELAGVTVEELAEELNARVLTDVPEDSYIERFFVGAMGAETALRHLRRTKDAAVITGGDRSEIHTAALEAPGVKCLILTGGFEPPGAVIGKAEEKGVPILLVQSDTLTAVDRAEDVVRTGRTRDEKTVQSMKKLLYEHANIDELIGED